MQVNQPEVPAPLVPAMNVAQPAVTTAGVQKLNGNNFLPWRRQVTIILKLRGLERALERSDVPEQVDLQATLVLLESMDDSHRLQVQAEASAFAIMANLDRQYANRSLATKHRLLSSFLRMTKSSQDTLNQHVGKLKELRSALANLHEQFTEDFFQVVIINSLPSEFGNFMDQWEMTHSSMKTTEFLLSILQQKEASLKQDAVALVTKGRDFYSLPIEERKKISRCKKCKQKGHWGDECPNKGPEPPASSSKKESGAQAKPAPTRPINLVTLSSGALSKTLREKWVLDSGATEHMCNDRRWFKDLVIFATPKTTSVGSGETIMVVGSGVVELISKVGPDQLVITLNKVSFVPKLITNLVSVGASAGRGIVTTFGKDCCAMEAAGHVVATGTLTEEDLYVLQFSPRTVGKALLAETTRSMREWHEALGHPGKDRLTKLFADKELGIKMTGNELACAVCPAAKGHHVRHPTRTSPEATEVGENVHVDLGFISNKETSSYYYYLLCKDEASEFCLIYFIDSKAAVKEALMKLIIDFEVGSGKSIHAISSDNGSEFCNRAVQQIFLRERIKHHLSAPYVAQQNGRIEREMRTINNSARAMLIQSGLGPKLATEALKTACYLKNRLPTTRSALTPVERFTNRKPHLAHLVPFGKQVQVLDNGHVQSKFEPRTVAGYVVGFTDRRNTLRVFIPKFRRVMEVCDFYFAPPLSGDEKVDEPPPEEARLIFGIVQGDTEVVFDDEPLEAGAPPDDSRDFQFETANDQHWSSTPERRVIGKNGRPYCTRAELEAFFREELEEHREAAACQDRESSISSLDSQQVDREDDGAALTRDESVDVVESAPAAEIVAENNRPAVTSPHPHASSLLLAAVAGLSEPQTYEQAVDSPDSEQWQKAIQDELAAHEQNGTWIETEKPAGAKALSTKWVFTLKRDAHGHIERFKARLVVRGFEQRVGVDYLESFAPVAKVESIRTLLAVATIRNLSMIQFDVSTAFLYGEVEETVYIEPPKAVEVGAGKCLRLIKALYGLCQAPRCWNNKMNQTLIEIGLQPTESDPCVYTNEAATLYLCLYVDDGLIFGVTEEDCKAIAEELRNRFKVKLMGGEMFLGIEIRRDKDGIDLSQARYIGDVLERFNMAEAKGASSPLADVKELVDTSLSPPTTAPYREAIGSLLYVANCTRPDLLFAVNLLARFSQHPTEMHWIAVKHILRYLKETRTYALRYARQTNELAAYCDADWASSLSSRYSTSGVLITLGGGPIVYCSRKQTSIAQSSTEAEYIAANDAAKELAWTRQLLAEIKFVHQIPDLHIDNQSTIRQIRNHDTKRRSKHIELRYNYVRHKLHEGLFRTKYIPTTSQPADLLTKPLGGQAIQRLLESSGMLRITRRVRKPEGGTLALLALALVAALAIGQVADSYEFVRADPLVWKPADSRVGIGTGFVEINYKPISPCAIDEAGEWSSEQDIKRTIYRGLNTECERDYDGQFNSLLDQFAKCWGNRSDGKNRKRPKREPVTVFLLITTVVMVVGWLGQLIYSYLDPDSSYNRLNKVEEREKEREKQVHKMEIDLREARDIRQELINVTSALDKRVQSNAVAVKQVATLMPVISFSAANMSIVIAQERDMMKRMIRACANNQASPDDYADLFKFEPLRGLAPEDTHLDSVHRKSDGLFILDVYYQMYSSDTRVYKIHPLAHYVNVTTAPTLVRYTGPKWVIFNTTSECVRGVENPADSPVRLHCRDANYTDPRLDSWVEVPDTDPEHPKYSSPQVAQSATENIISCLFHTITINGTLFDCPHYPFVVPITVPFQLPLHSHEVRTEYLNVIERNIKYKTPHLREEPGQSTYSELIRQLAERNRHSVVSGRLGVENSTLTIPLDALSIIGVLSGASLLCASLVCLKSCLQNPPSTGMVTNLFANPSPPAQPTVLQSPPPRPSPPAPIYASLHYPSVDEERSSKIDFPPAPPMCTYAQINHGVLLRPHAAQPGLPFSPPRLYATRPSA